MEWHSIYEEPIAVTGLPWAQANKPDLWRLPRRDIDDISPQVARLARYAAGASIRFCTDSRTLYIRASAVSETDGHGMDVYVDGIRWRNVEVTDSSDEEIFCFEAAFGEQREITLYLPRMQETRVSAVGIDPGATLTRARAFDHDTPLVLYGSSIAQGAHAGPGMGYGAQLGRALNLEVVNLGFGGAGKAEFRMAELVSEIDACCFVLDVGKSYGMQSSEALASMLKLIRADHATTPVICITPIFSTREIHEPEYAERSRHTRHVVREAVTDLIGAGDSNILLVEGSTLLGRSDADGLHTDGVHPSDLGHTRIAARLGGIVSDVLSWAVED